MKMKNNRELTLLTLAIFLAILNFVVVPVFDWQEQKVENLNQLQARLTRIEDLLARKSELEQTIQSIDKIEAEVRAALYRMNEESKFKLAQQQNIEFMLYEQNLTPTLIEWKSTVPTQFDGIRKYELSLSFDGLTVDIMRFTAEIGRQKPIIEVSEFFFSSSGITKNSVGYIKGARMNVIFYVEASA